MTRNRLLRLIIPVITLGLVVLLQGCYTLPPSLQFITPDERVLPAAAPEQVETRSSVEQIDQEIATLRRQIAETKKDVAALHTDAVSAAEQHTKSRGWMRGVNDFQDPPIDQYARNTADALAGEKRIKQLERSLSMKQQERRAALSQSVGCFPPDALVQMADGSTRPFAEVRPGDLVMTYDIGDQEPVGRPVVELYAVDANHLYTVNGALVTTGGERLLSQEGWKEVAELQPGDRVHVDGQMIDVTRIDYRREEIHLHNMQVADTHNFYIATGDGRRYLVHNSGGGGGGGGGGK